MLPQRIARQESRLECLSKASGPFALRQGAEQRGVAQYGERRMKRADVILGGDVDASLATDTCVDLSDQRRRARDPRQAATEGRGRKAGDVGHGSATDGNDHVGAFQLGSGERAPQLLDRRHALDLLAAREHDALPQLGNAISNRRVNDEKGAALADEFGEPVERTGAHDTRVATGNRCHGRRRGRINDGVGSRLVQPFALMLKIGEAVVVDREWSTLRATIRFDARPQYLGGRVEPQHACVLGQQPPSTRSGQRTATRGDHTGGTARDQLAEDRLLKLAKGLLAVGEQVGNRTRRAPFDLAINVDKVNALERS